MGNFRRRMRYRFDNVLSRGTWAVLLWLGLATLLAILLSSLLLTVFDVTLAGSEDTSWPEDFWQSLLRTIDPGTMASDVGWGRRVLALVVTLFGVLIAGTLIGIIASGVEQRIEAMQRGRSGVVESDHVVILGASSRLPALIEQLALAGRDRRRNVIVVLANQAPTELSREVRSANPNLHGAHVVFRWGDPKSVSDLEIVAPASARAVIVLADDEDTGSAGVVRAVLAVGVALGRESAIPVVAEVHDPQVGRDLVTACGDSVHPITPDQAIARLATYAFRGPHLIRIVQELVDFTGADLYVLEPREAVGGSFADVVLAYADVRPIGLIDPAGGVELGPDPTTAVTAGHRLVVIADGDSTPTRWTGDAADSAELPPLAAEVPSTFRSGGDVESRVQHVLIVGWNALARQLVDQLDDNAAPGSSVTIVFDPVILHGEPDVAGYERLGVTLVPLKAGAVHLDVVADPRTLTAVLMVAYRDGLSPDEADSRTMLNRQILRREMLAAGHEVSVLIELRDAANVDLVAPIGPDDFVISDALVSSMIAQLAEQPLRRAVLLRLYTDQRPGIGTVDAASLGIAGAVEFHEVARRCYACGMIAIGWCMAPERGDTVQLNPLASARLDLEPDDRIVVIG